MRPESRRLAKITTAISIVASILTAIGVPAAFFAFNISHERGELVADAQDRARQISQIISRNPEFWQFDAHGIDGILATSNKHHSDDFRWVILGDGEVAYEYKPEEVLPSFSISTSQDLFESGTVVGEVRIVHSTTHVVFWTGIVAIGAAFLAIATFFLVRRFPMRAMEAAWEEASHDPLTGLPNRVLLSDRLDHALSVMRRTGEPVAILCFDLDHFKDVNDTFGHGTGDMVLKEVARRLSAHVRDYDTVARLSGDEFVVLLLDVGEPQDVAETARKLIDVVSQPYELDGQRALIGTSIGIAVPHDQETGVTQLLQNGDAALYRAKANGRRTYCFFDDEMNEALRKRREAERELITALNEEQFVVYYQPQVNLKSGRITGVEALLRWAHPSRGLLDPDFITLAEETGLIVPIGEWVLRTACTECARWPDIQLSVNISPVQLVKSDVVSMVRRVLDETGFEPQRLELEITESVLIERTDTVLTALNELKKMGIRIAMDDFGTGYSSLSYLRKFPFDRLKIDGSFLQELEDKPEVRSLVQAIISMGESLNMDVIAEGVETSEQADWLISERCVEAQGFHFTRPLNSRDIDKFIHGFGAKAEETRTRRDGGDDDTEQAENAV